MPIVGSKDKNFIQRMKAQDSSVLDFEEAATRDINEIHIGIVNMMSDAALIATENQFLWPLQYCSSTLQIVPHFISIDGLDRKGEAAEYVAREYESLEDVHGLDIRAMIVTGANVMSPDLKKNNFWEPLTEVIDYAEENVISTLYSCLSTHAYMLHKHGVERKHLNEKRWGVYEHRIWDESNPLTEGMDSVVVIPHSRWNEITQEDFIKSGMRILIAGESAGVHMVTSRDGLRMVGWQGHPEYDTVSLLKEWQRDIGLYAEGDLEKEPPFPAHYLKGKGLSLTENFRRQVEQGEFFNFSKKGQMPPDLEKEVIDHTPNRWSSARRILLSNWVGAILNKVNAERNAIVVESQDSNSSSLSADPL